MSKILRGKTLAKALRMRSTLAHEIADAKHRAINNAISEADLGTPDFNTTLCIADFRRAQCNLRGVKTETATLSVLTKVLIPSDLPVEEAGTSVPLIQAVLIRDDMKSAISFYKQLTTMDASNYRPHFGEDKEVIVKERNFNFQEILEDIDKIQDAVDTIDDIIQGTDATTRFPE